MVSLSSYLKRQAGALWQNPVGYIKNICKRNGLCTVVSAPYNLCEHFLVADKLSFYQPKAQKKAKLAGRLLYAASISSALAAYAHWPEDASYTDISAAASLVQYARHYSEEPGEGTGFPYHKLFAWAAGGLMLAGDFPLLYARRNRRYNDNLAAFGAVLLRTATNSPKNPELPPAQTGENPNKAMAIACAPR